MSSPHEAGNGPPACAVCGKPRTSTAAVSVVLVGSPTLARPFRLCPDDGCLYTVCGNDGCAGVRRFVEKAIDSHPMMRQAAGMHWEWARVLFDDGMVAFVNRQDRRDVLRPLA